MRFQNKIYLISGGARGLGEAQARRLVAEGAQVVIGDVLDAEGLALAVEIGSACAFVHLDVTQEDSWAQAVEKAESLGALSGLVNNAGIYKPMPLLDTDAAFFLVHPQLTPNAYRKKTSQSPSKTKTGFGRTCWF